MFSYEDLLRAVQLCIKLGKRIGLTIRQLSDSTKNALRTWYRHAEQLETWGVEHDDVIQSLARPLGLDGMLRSQA